MTEDQARELLARIARLEALIEKMALSMGIAVHG